MEGHGVSRESMVTENVIMALECNYSKGSVDKTVELLLFFNDAINGKLEPITYSTAEGTFYHQLMGADNRNGVTCYLDTLIFSMFSRLESFEPMLSKYFNYEVDPKKASLAIFLRLYVNMVRKGKLITTDITRILLSAIRKAGWNESCFTKQQDAADLFTFIADELDMPMITLKLEIAHEGKEDKTDDHKLINERMLLVSVPGGKGDEPILLEECLESYFANSINVSRQLERRKTLESAVAPTGRSRKFSVSIQTKELNASSSSVNVVESTSQIIYDENGESSEFPPSYNSLFKPNYNYPDEKSANPLWTPKMEINLPAWMFLQLVPFYTNSTSPSKTGLPIPNATKEFATTRPVLGICLKRSEWGAESHSTLNNREVSVPQVIRFPSFVADDEESTENSPSNYVLVLESAIFHRGTSTESGHFVAMIKENSDIGYVESLEVPLESSGPRWLLFDDLLPAGEKVKQVVYDDVFHVEKPYILFYRLVTLQDFEHESDRHRFDETRPTTPVPVMPAPPPSSSVVSFASVADGDGLPPSPAIVAPRPEVASTSMPSLSLPALVRKSASIRRKAKSRSTSVNAPTSRSPSPLRHSLDDSRNALAMERHPPTHPNPNPVMSTSLKIPGAGNDDSFFKRSKSVRHKHKSSKEVNELDEYRKEKCLIQ